MMWSIVSADLRRKAKYLSISGMCFTFHYALLRYQVLALGWRPEWLCNAIAFEVSAQVNFVLTRLVTWGDRPDNLRRAWLIYNRTALVSLGLNTVGFQAVYRLAPLVVQGEVLGWVPLLAVAQLSGAVLGLLYTYHVCDTKIFRHSHQAYTGNGQVRIGTRAELPPADEPRRLVIETENLQERAPGSLDGVTVLMPAKNEISNLMRSVASAVVTVSDAGLDCTVAVVDDGGSDGTPALSRRIAREFPAYVVVVHHVDQYGQPFNQGYATAMNNGLDVAVRTGRRLIVTTDSDGQFRAADMVALAEYALAERKDAAFGYRVDRADSLRRKLSGHAWTWLTRLWTHVWVRDADCALKAFDWRAASRFSLVGRYGMAGAELTAWARALKLNVGQFPVQHLPRLDVENQTGGSLSVILGSFASLPSVYLNLVRQGHRWRRTRRLVRPLDAAAGAVTAVAGAVSLASFLRYYSRGQTLLYPDAMSHLTIARRVISNPTTGVAQLGTTWLPFTHLAALWGVWNSHLFYSGIAGSAVSMAAFVVAARYLFKLGRSVTGHTAGGLIAAAVLVFNPNAQYLQATPMTELVLLAALSVSTYYLLEWSRTDDWRDLMLASLGSLVACLTRYEAWPFALAMLAVVAYVELRSTYHQEFAQLAVRLVKAATPVALVSGAIAVGLLAGTRGSATGPAYKVGLVGCGMSLVSPWWRERRRLQKLRGNVLFCAVVGVWAIIAWPLWGYVVNHNFLDFYSGEYSKPSLWVSTHDVAIGNLPLALRTYWIAVTDNLSAWVVAVGLAGLAAYLIRTRLRPETVAPLALWIFGPFFVYSLYAGERPLHVPQIGGDLYNLRFGLVMTLALAVFGTYLVVTVASSLRRWAHVLVPAAAAIAVGAVLAVAATSGTPVTLQEGMAFQKSPVEAANHATAAWLRAHYDGGRALIQNNANETVTFESRIPYSNIIYEGNNHPSLWKTAIRYPQAVHVRWIVLRRAPQPDNAYRSLIHAPDLMAYQVVYRSPDYLVYRLKAAGPLRKHGDVTRTTAAAPRATAQGPPGIPAQATWSWWPKGRCSTSLARSGATLIVSNPANGRRVTCQVLFRDKYLGQEVALAPEQFQRLLPRDRRHNIRVQIHRAKGGRD